MQKLGNPIPLFLDARGCLLDGGQIYVGVAGGDPETTPITVYWDNDLTQVAAQPLRTIGGRIVNGADPASVYLGQADYSMRILDADGSLVDYSPSIFTDSSSFQPHSDTLDDLAAATITDFGLSVLGTVDAGALNTLLGTGNSLPLSGGTMTGDITKQGAGKFVFWAGSGMTSGRLFLTAKDAADPTSQPGDIWLEKAS